MGNVLGNNKTLKEQVREQKRVIERSIRTLERERGNLERNEKKLIIDIKNNAKKNQIKAVQIQAKDLIRLRNNNTKFLNLIANLRAISLQITTMASTQTMTDSMKQITKSMNTLNKQMNLPELTKIMQEFQKQSEMMNMKSDMIGDSIDDTMDSATDEAESEQVVAQVLDELGVQLDGSLIAAPTGKNVVSTTTSVAAPQEDTLEARMNNLK